MLYSMLCLVLLVFTLTGQCRGDSDNSSTSLTLLPPEPAWRRMSAAQAHSLRRQLMRDNYDYPHSADDRQTNITASSGGDTKSGTDHLPRASELAQAKSSESAHKDQSKQRGQFEQRGQHDQPDEYEHRGQHVQLNQYEQGRHHKQPGEYEHSGQYEQSSEHEQRGQYQQPGEHEQRGRYDQHDRHEHHGRHKQRGQRKHHGQHEKRERREQRGQNEQREHSEQQEQLGQYDEQEQAQSIEQKPRAVPSLHDAPPVAVPFTDDLTVREYTPDWREIQPKQAQYPPEPPFPALMERRPFSDLRGNYKEQYGQNDSGNDMRARDEMVNNPQESPDQEYAPDEQEAFDQQDASGTQNDEGSDFSENKKHVKIYNEFVMRSTTRANRLQYYMPAPDERNAPPPHRNALPPHGNAPPQHRNAPNHNISKKDLLYYMDDSQLRRRDNDASPDVPDEDQPADDQLPSPQPSLGPNSPDGPRPGPGSPARRPAPTEEELPCTSRTRRSFFVTVSANNVTYKLLTLKSRSGRRQDERRFLEERGPAGVALVSLDRAPLPALRLPRARRQYMHAPRHHRRHEPA